MKVAIELPAAQAAQLDAEAKRLGVSAEELARAAVTDLLAKNLELYRRLA